jgi:hypothetical protein
MVYEKEVAMLAGGSAAGIVQTYLLQKFVDSSGANWMPMLGGFGKPSALVGIAAGAVAIAVGFVSMKTHRFLGDPRLQNLLVAYGGAALTTGILSGMSMTQSMARAFPRAAAVRAVPAGGYSQPTRKEMNIL